ncbi:hypothetical protein RHMOL_Rhmol02G0148300 [Rhododendron molle]|uniref:Uncharacterized protein n=1 Tax=Rhododendron molle TaxID=49168 RepID=A0ACC0PRL5_RHOML|nr:hypothetical protein RHMOL_Rhmol02G0148300 [Rhododendron molle]
MPFVLDPVHGFHLYGYGLGYDSSKDDYKVVMLSLYDAESVSVSVSKSESSTLSGITTVVVYSHKTNAWRRIQDSHYVLDVTSSGVYYNGCLHWLCWRDGLYVMVAFNWADEIFREVTLPASFVHNEFAYYRMLIVGDCLCLVDKRSSIVWMMEEYRVTPSWTKIMICIRNMPLLCVLGLFAEEEFVLKIKGKIIQRLGKDILVVYNPKQGTVRDIVVHGLPTEFRLGAPMSRALSLLTYVIMVEGLGSKVKLS